MPRFDLFGAARAALWLTAAAGAGCAHNQMQAPAEQPVAKSHTTPAPQVAVQAAPKDDLEEMLQGNALHFDYDRANLTTESQDRLLKIAEILRSHPGLTIRIEGNCDERGGEEFNLQLGQERAAAAKKYLVNLGIAPDLIATISYGKDKPENPAHSEPAWAQNRRDDIRPVASR